MKIWWQTSTPLATSRLDDYRNALKEHLHTIKRQDTELKLSGVDHGSLALDYDFVEFLNSSSREGGVFQKIIQAEREGYDGVAIGCFLDPALYQVREVVDIPVFGLGETCMHIACMLGYKFSGVAFCDKQALRYDRYAAMYGLDGRLVPFGTLGIDFGTLADAFKNPQPLINAFMEVAKGLVEKGAEVIIPACGALDLILAREGINNISGALILDCDAVLLKFTEAMVDLRSHVPYTVSRKLFYAKPPKERLAEIMELYKIL